MAKNENAYFLDTQDYTITNFTSSDGTGIKTIVSGATNDSWVYEIFITMSGQATSVPVQFYLSDSADTVNVGLKDLTSTASVNPDQGFSLGYPNPYRMIQGTDNNNMFYRLLDRDQNYYIPLPAGYKIKAQCQTAMTGGTMNFTVFKRNF